MSHIEVLGANIPRASESIIQCLIDAGYLYVGDDNELHITENEKSTTNGADQS